MEPQYLWLTGWNGVCCYVPVLYAILVTVPSISQHVHADDKTLLPPSYTLSNQCFGIVSQRTPFWLVAQASIGMSSKSINLSNTPFVHFTVSKTATTYTQQFVLHSPTFAEGWGPSGPPVPPIGGSFRRKLPVRSTL